MGNKIPLEGMRFGKLVVLSEHPVRQGKQIMWVCKCDCGNTKVINGHNLRSGASTTCGCSIQRHGMRNTRLPKEAMMTAIRIITEHLEEACTQ